MIHYLALAGSILLGVGGQLLLKGGTLGAGNITQQLLHPFTIGGFGIYVVSGVLYVVALRGLPVSIAFPSVAASYGLVAIAAGYLWNEPLGLQQIGGIVLISVGLLVLHAR